MRFSRALRRADRGLAMAGPGRSRILLEMAQDLEGLYRAYVAGGMDSVEAERRAEAVVGTSPEAVAELARLHASPLALLLARFSGEGRHRAERMILTAVTLLAIGGGVGALAASGMARSPSPLVWPLVVLGAVGAGLATRRAIELFGDVAPGGPPARLTGILVVAAMCLATGVAGAAYEGWMLAAHAGGSAGVSREAAGHLGRGAEVLTLGMSTALALSLAWFHLRLHAIALLRADAEIRRLIETCEGGLP